MLLRFLLSSQGAVTAVVVVVVCVLSPRLSYHHSISPSS